MSLCLKQSIKRNHSIRSNDRTRPDLPTLDSCFMILIILDYLLLSHVLHPSHFLFLQFEILPLIFEFHKENIAPYGRSIILIEELVQKFEVFRVSFDTDFFFKFSWCTQFVGLSCTLNTSSSKWVATWTVLFGHASNLDDVFAFAVFDEDIACAMAQILFSH